MSAATGGAGGMLRKLRVRRGLTMRAAAATMGISAAYLSDLERGNRTVGARAIERAIPAYALAVDEIEDIIRAACDERTAAFDELLQREYRRIYPGGIA